LGEPKKVHEYLVQENREVVIRVVWEKEPGEIVDGEVELLEAGEDDE
jgi:hypothetical protein